ncbi:putative endopeptidase [Halpernia humi]|uniref:Putative endopeptidase n=1 Tax=Halpernia humi TaxID=493375 RepID=A0A1H5UIH1_9FLAO|nr:M13 family metallopeptidase [Halpernia humi]SEF74826.1 putative endopeptidase [Halpernia humi]
MKPQNHFLILILSLFFLGACKKKEIPPVDFLSTDIDSTVRPNDDFFDYANGGWIKKHPIPDQYSSNGIGRLVIDDLQKRLKTINEEAVKNPKDDISKKIANFWKSGLDTLNIDKSGFEPLKNYLAEIDAINDESSLLTTAADLQKIGVSTLFNAGVAQDSKKSSVMAYNIDQGGLGLPNRDYYFNTDAQTTKVRNLYPKHIQRILAMIGQDSATAKKSAENTFNLETQMAKSSRKLEGLRDPYKNYNKYKIADIQPKLTPNIDWVSWLNQADVKKVDSVIIGQPEYLKSLSGLLKSTPIDVWKNYMKYHLVSEFASYLSKNFDQENFDFYGKTLNGTKKQEVRWKRVLGTEENAIGEALGQLFVKENFDATAKKRYENIVEEIRGALKERIQKLDWMSPETKVKALDKLAKMKKKVGYPDKWKDFSAMEIKDQPYVLNVIAANKWQNNYDLNKLGKPVNRDEWEMTPQTYNAYYNPSNNEIVLPAGIFIVPGTKDADLDDALVYGYAAASTIGHEITHGFDDEGRQFDAQGNLKNWWTPEDVAKFNKRADVMVNEFNQFEPIKGIHINGKATLGENIADLGGVLLGWDAFTKTKQYKEGKKLHGQTPAERFFLGYSLGWLYNIRKESLAQRLLTDVHSPAKYRVNGPFPNVEAFYKTFNIKKGDKMYIPDSLRVKIW